MGVNIQIIDEHFGKSKLAIFELNHPSETITVKELITRRVEDEIAAVNARNANPERVTAEHRMFLAGLTKLSPEVLLNDAAQRRRRKPIDPDSALKVALKAFEKGRYFVIINGSQVEKLTDEITLEPQTEAIFLQLTPLVGG